jgi:hypothetical protein
MAHITGNIKFLDEDRPVDPDDPDNKWEDDDNNLDLETVGWPDSFKPPPGPPP